MGMLSINKLRKELIADVESSLNKGGYSPFIHSQIPPVDEKTWALLETKLKNHADKGVVLVILGPSKTTNGENTKVVKYNHNFMLVVFLKTNQEDTMFDYYEKIFDGLCANGWSVTTANSELISGQTSDHYYMSFNINVNGVYRI